MSLEITAGNWLISQLAFGLLTTYEPVISAPVSPIHVHMWLPILGCHFPALPPYFFCSADMLRYTIFPPNDGTKQFGQRIVFSTQFGHRTMFAEQFGHRTMFAEQFGHRTMFAEQFGHRTTFAKQFGHRTKFSKQFGHRTVCSHHTRSSKFVYIRTCMHSYIDR